VIRPLPDGTTELVQVPLTLEDVLHPQFGDFIVESTLHDLVRDYLADVFRARTYADPTALVLSDTGVYWDDPDLKHHCPDVALVFGVKDRDANRNSFRVSEEKTRPRLIVEIVSPDTRDNDVEKKVRHYHRARVAHYVIVDRVRQDDPWQLRGFLHAPGKYLEMPTDERGRLWLEDVGVWLSAEGRKVVCYDGETDEPIPDYGGLSQQLANTKQQAEAEKQRAEAEKQRAEAAEARARQMEEELARLRGPKPTP
jgi:Uma2 family endonuclease